MVVWTVYGPSAAGQLMSMTLPPPAEMCSVAVCVSHNGFARPCDGVSSDDGVFTREPTRSKLRARDIGRGRNSRGFSEAMT